MAEAAERVRGKKGVTASQLQAARTSAFQACVNGEVRATRKRSKDPAQVQAALVMLARAKG